MNRLLPATIRQYSDVFGEKRNDQVLLEEPVISIPARTCINLELQPVPLVCRSLRQYTLSNLWRLPSEHSPLSRHESFNFEAFTSVHYCGQSLLFIPTKSTLFFWRDSPQWARVSWFMRFLGHTQRRTTVGRSLLDQWSAVADTSTWQNTTLTTDRHPCPRWGSKPQSQQTSGRRPTS
jgi:hypothetical protein